VLLAVVTTPLLVVCCWLELIANGSHLHQESIPVIRVPGPPSSTSTAISATRNHLHNHSVGPFNASHRVTRRKSLSSNTATIAAVAQAMKEAAEARLLPGTAPMAVVAAAPGAPGPEKLQADGVGLGGYPSPPSSLPNHGPLNNATIVAADYGIQQLRTAGGATLLGGSAIADGHAPEVSRGSSRSRRASDGAGALGGVGKIGRMRSGSELKCEKCGKGYKHSSCLTKHLFVSPPPPLLRVFKATRTASQTPWTCCVRAMGPHRIARYLSHTHPSFHGSNHHHASPLTCAGYPCREPTMGSANPHPSPTSLTALARITITR